MGASGKDYYAILGLDHIADERAIKGAFRRQARRCHPDVNAGDAASEQLFKDVHAAYKTLIDPERRRRYDDTRLTATAGTPDAGGVRAAAPSPSPSRGRASGGPVRTATEPGPGAWRRFWREERAFLAYIARGPRRGLTHTGCCVRAGAARAARLGHRARVGAVCGLLLVCLLLVRLFVG